MRYGSKKPFNKPYSGRLCKLSKEDLCEVYNGQYNNQHFCDLLISELETCKAKERCSCQQKEVAILDKVRKQGHYLEIAKVLYYKFIALVDPTGVPKMRGTSAESKT